MRWRPGGRSERGAAARPHVEGEGTRWGGDGDFISLCLRRRSLPEVGNKDCFRQTGYKIMRCGQDSNLCGQSPMDFKSISLTTRTPQLIYTTVALFIDLFF